MRFVDVESRRQILSATLFLTPKEAALLLPKLKALRASTPSDELSVDFQDGGDGPLANGRRIPRLRVMQYEPSDKELANWSPALRAVLQDVNFEMQVVPL